MCYNDHLFFCKVKMYLIILLLLIIGVADVNGWSCSTLTKKECEESCICGLCDEECIKYISTFDPRQRCSSWKTGVGGSSCDEFYHESEVWIILIAVAVAVTIFCVIPFFTCLLCKKSCCCCCPC